MSIEEKFHAGVKVIQSLPKDGPYQPSNSTKLKFYSLFKQATEGPCKQAKPAFWDVVGRVKWETWNKLGEMGKEEAMVQYVEELKKVIFGLEKIVETMSFNGDVQEFLDSIGPFYEFINLQGPEMKHIKDAVEEATSSSNSGSSSSSMSNSAVGSPTNSIPNSPLAAVRNVSVTNVDKTGKTSEEENEAEETIKSTAHLNGYLPQQEKMSVQNASSSVNVDVNVNDDTNATNTSPPRIPPPKPKHTQKSIANGHAKFSKESLEETEREDEVLEIRHSQNGYSEENVHEFYNGHKKISSKASIETTGSGGESEKYYSGDSEPEYDERYSHLFSNVGVAGIIEGSSGYQSYEDTDANRNKLSKTNLNGHLKRVGEHIVTRSYNNNNDQMTASSSSYLDIANRSTDGEVVLHATVDRLNRDVDHILARLRILEAAYAASADGNVARNNGATRRKRRIFGDLSTSTLVLIFTWPFAAHFIIKLISWWLRRRRRMGMIGARLPITN